MSFCLVSWGRGLGSRGRAQVLSLRPSLEEWLVSVLEARHGEGDGS